MLFVFLLPHMLVNKDYHNDFLGGVSNPCIIATTHDHEGGQKRSLEQIPTCNHVGEVFVFMQISVHESRFDVIVPKPALTGSTTGYRLTVVETIVRQ